MFMIVNAYYFMFLFWLIRFSCVGISLLFIYSNMGVKNNWRALIPFIGFKPLFDYINVPFGLLTFSLVPKYGVYVFASLMCFVFLRFCVKIKKGFWFTFGMTVIPELFLILVACDKNINYDYVDDLELLRLEILERERLGI